MRSKVKKENGEEDQRDTAGQEKAVEQLKPEISFEF